MKAYIVGVVAADGYIRDREVRIATSCAEYSKILCGLIERMGLKCRVASWKRSLVIRIYSKQFSEDIRNMLNLQPGRKARYITLPNLSGSEILEFIAGFFDGDGSFKPIVSGLKNNRWGPYITPRIVISSKSENFIIQLAEKLVNYGFVNPHITYDSHVCRLKFYGYSNACTFIKVMLPYMKHPLKIKDAMAWANSCREVSG